MPNTLTKRRKPTKHPLIGKTLRTTPIYSIRVPKFCLKVGSIHPFGTMIGLVLVLLDTSWKGLLLEMKKSLLLVAAGSRTVGISPTSPSLYPLTFSTQSTTSLFLGSLMNQISSVGNTPLMVSSLATLSTSSPRSFIHPLPQTTGSGFGKLMPALASVIFSS